MSLARQEFHENCEAGINAQINKELGAMYAYMAMANHFSRDDIALSNIASFFKDSAQEEKEHAEKLMEYQVKRGGRVVLTPIDKPAKTDFDSALDAFQTALALEKYVNKALLDLHAVSDTHNDYQMSDFLEGEYLKEQVDAIKQLSDYCAQLKLVGDGLGVYHFDKTFK
ncbi:soma ferritin-like [Sycon ciliatum]|uniref:soma ferritin-like n=1 Tax=Sycon ciliatum TaxID=27933 RepID=UPI0020AE7DAE|eukprot:scpid13617/ scgid8007/ Soma ferritin